MNRRPVIKGVPAVPHRKQRRRRGIVPTGGQAPLSAKELKRHARLLAEGKPMSGRCGGFVYYVRNGKQCWRRDVPHQDPRTFAQLRARAVFGAASRTWSQGAPLTEKQRDTWYADGAKTQSRPRLGQSGTLTGQQRFVGRNSTKERRHLGMLLDPRQRKTRQSQLKQPQPLIVAAPRPRPVKRGYHRKAKRRFLTAQLA